MSCTLFLLFFTFWVPIFQTYTNSHDSDSKKVFLKFKDSFCLFPENVIEGNQVEIGLEDCDKLVHDMENKAIWFSFSDDRLRTNNGLCLKPFKNFLVVSSCSPNANENSEIWKIDEEKRLQNENQDCAQIAGMKLFVFKCNKLSTTGFEMVKFSDKEMNLMKTRYAQNKLRTYDPQRLQQLHDQSDALIKHYVQVEKNIEQIKKREVEMQKDKARITHLINEIKLLLHVSASLKHFGTGAIMNIYDGLDIKNRKSIIKAVVEQLDVNQNMLLEMGIQKGKTKIVITSFINAPYEDHYTFTAKNIRGSLRILLDNEEIISNSKHSLENDNISSPLVFIPKYKLVPIYIEIASEQNLPSFTLFWSSKHLHEQVVNSLYLYTTMYDKVCYTPIQKRVDCSATFESMSKGGKETNEFQIVCPSECGSQDKFPVYKKKDTSCYEMNSSICGSAIHSNFMTNEVGGIIKVQFKKEEEEENKICATVAPSASVDFTFRGITDIKLIDVQDFFEKFEQNKEEYRGFQGVVTDDTHALLYKSDPTKSLITDIDIDCKEKHSSENSQEEQETGVGSFVIKRTHSSSVTNTDDESFVIDLFALFDNYTNKSEKEESTKDWNLPGWTRKSCNDIQLFIKYGKPSDLFQFPSLLLTCEDTFEDIHFKHNPTINARCLPFCSNQKKVSGSFIYGPNSPVCKSAMHSGVISKEGGIIEITKMDNISQAIPNSVRIVRNGIEAEVNNTKNKYSFYVSKPKGIFCNFPRTSINVNEPLNTETEFFSFIETRSTNSSSSSMQSPPVVLVSMKHAVMQQQLSNLFNVYSTEEYKKGLQAETAGNIEKEKTNESKKEDMLPNINIKEEEEEEKESVINTNSMKEKQNSLQQLTIKTQSILTSLMKRNTNLDYLNRKLATYRIEQKNYDEFIKSNESIAVSLIKQFNLITIHKKNRIEVLERSLTNIKPNSVETFQETYQSNNINNNYIIVDSIHSIHGTSNWKIEKFKAGHLFSAITNDSLIASDQDLFGSYILYKHAQMYKGFISVDFKIPYEGIMGVLFKYKDSNNYNSFIISRNEYYFIDIIDGNKSEPKNKKPLDSSWHIGEWVHIFLDFGYKNVRAFINGKYACGYETQNSSNGYFGFGVNHSKEKVFIDKITIGSLEQARYFKGQSFGTDKEERSVSMDQKEDFEKEEGEGAGAGVTDHDMISLCKYFEESFKEPLEHNWLIPMNAKWSVKNYSGISSMWNKTDQQEAYVHSKQINVKDTITPSILLLKKDKFCISLKSFTFQSAMNVESNSKTGVLFRVLNSLDFLSIIIDTSESPGTIYMLKTTNGIPYQLLIPTHIEIKPHEWYHLKIQFDGIQLQAMLNDEKILNANLNEQSDEIGNLGLVVLVGEGKFKDIKFEPKGT